MTSPGIPDPNSRSAPVVPAGGLSDEAGRLAGRRFGFAFDQAAIGMALVGLDGTFLRVNRTLCNLVGRAADELMATTWQAITHPDDVAVGSELLGRALEERGDSFQLEKRYIRQDGRTVHVLITVSLVRDDSTDEPAYMFTQVVDLTEHKLSQRATQHLAAIVESTDEAILSIGLDQSITAWNPAAERMLGYTGEEALGRRVWLIVPPGHRRGITRILDDARRRTGSPYHETFLLPRWGSPLEVAVTVSPILDESDTPVGISIVARDINEHRWLATTLDVTLEALEAALAEAKEAEARSRRFLADAAHQLRTPITGIRACAETLLRAPPPEQAAGLLTDMVREASRAARLMDSLIRMSRLDQGEVIARSPGDLADVCAVEVDRARSRAGHLEITLADELTQRSQVLGFSAAGEILANLLDNATRHAVSHITVALRDVSEGVELRVSDDGPGVEEELRERIFERFGSFDGKGGSGLGLPIAQGLARAHGGDLTYEPSGNAFVALLMHPLGASSGSEVERPVSPAPDDVAGGGGGHTEPKAAPAP